MLLVLWRELVETWRDWRECGDLLGHLRGFWRTLWSDPDGPASYQLVQRGPDDAVPALRE